MGIIARSRCRCRRCSGHGRGVAKDFPVVLRRRKFTAATLAQTFVFGFLAQPDASDEELAQTAALCGVEVTTQAVEQRFTPRLAAFLEALFRQAIRHAIGAEPPWPPCWNGSPPSTSWTAPRSPCPTHSASASPAAAAATAGGRPR